VGFLFVAVGITADVGHLGHYCLIDSVTSTDPLDLYWKTFIPVSVQFYLYHLFSCDYRASCMMKMLLRSGIGFIELIKFLQ
jgi:hypothetical protein